MNRKNIVLQKCLNVLVNELKQNYGLPVKGIF